MSNGKVIAIVGAMGEGKTTYVKGYTSKSRRNSLCYLRIGSDFENDKKVNAHTNFMQFIKEGNKSKDRICIIDEAFTCLPKKLNIKMDNPNHPHNQLADFLVNSRKMNNWVFIIFHSLSQIPSEWLIPYLDRLVRFNTTDLMQYQFQRFKSFPNIANDILEYPTIEKYKPRKLKLR